MKRLLSVKSKDPKILFHKDKKIIIKVKKTKKKKKVFLAGRRYGIICKYVVIHYWLKYDIYAILRTLLITPLNSMPSKCKHRGIIELSFNEYVIYVCRYLPTFLNSHFSNHYSSKNFEIRDVMSYSQIVSFFHLPVMVLSTYQPNSHSWVCNTPSIRHETHLLAQNDKRSMSSSFAGPKRF